MRKSISVPTVGDRRGYCYCGSFERDEDVVHVFAEDGGHLVSVPVEGGNAEATARRALINYDSTRRQREGFGRRLYYPDVPH